MSDRQTLRQIAAETVSAILKGSYPFQGKTIPLDTEQSKQGTQYYAPDSFLAEWARSLPESSPSLPTKNSILEISTLHGARLLASILRNNSEVNNKVAVLNFASATKPGGGFLNGAQAQEESIARSSTLYPTLLQHSAQKFYDLHICDPENYYYSHAMIYSPDIEVFRDDYGRWLHPITVDVLTCAAVDAGKVRAFAHNHHHDTEASIKKEMRERMGRILYLLEGGGVKNIVLGSFGTGVFHNDIGVVARLWAELLTPKAQFGASFDRVIFAVLGNDTFVKFKSAFWQETQLEGLGALVVKSRA
jgi:uncharacterized protein (TIGR02452 family)